MPGSKPSDITLHRGILSIGIIAALSAASILILFFYISYRYWRWPSYHRDDIKKNPFTILLANLFLADFVQALAFLFDFHWYALDAIESYTAPCTVQGFFINLGDVSSAFFVLAIAIQTWAHIKFQQRLQFQTFVTVIVSVWIFAFVLTILGPVTTSGYFVDTGAWCWVHPDFNSQRLAYHYFWVFLVEFGTIFVYGFIIWELYWSSHKLQMQHDLSCNQVSDTHRRIRKSCLIMCCYPLLYITLTLPLAASRMLEISGKETSIGYRVFCGCFLVSSGWVDTFMYILTRASFLRSQSRQKDGDKCLTSTKPAVLSQQKIVAKAMQHAPYPALGINDSLDPTRMTSTSSWSTNWSDTQTLPDNGVEMPLSAIDGTIRTITIGALNMDAKI